MMATTAKQRWLVFLMMIAAALLGERPTRAQEIEQGAATHWLTFGELPPIPDAEGFAGMYAGVSHDVLIVAGGANFPNGRPWDGGKKVWYDNIFVLEKPDGAWKKVDTKLPKSMAYGVSLNHDDAVICMGGGDGEQHDTDVFALRWEDGRVKIDREGLPPLPKPMEGAAGVIIGDRIYLAGGIEKPEGLSPSAMHNFWMLDLAQPAEKRAWEELDPWPGPARFQAIAGTMDGDFFLFTGAELQPGDQPGTGKRKSPYLTDAYRYTPKTGKWKRLADMPRPAPAAPGPAIPIGQAHLVIMGGGHHNTLGMDLSKHKGFTRKILAYHTIADVWIDEGLMPEGMSRVTAPVTSWHGGWVIPNGEIRAGVRSPKVYFVKQPPQRSAFGVLNWIVLVGYLGGMLGIGLYCSRREAGTEDFFLAGRRIPWWAAGLSIFGTQLSAITFMTIPAIAFGENWTRMIAAFTIVGVAPIIVYFFLPFYRRLNVTTSYEYLEKRFGLPVRLLGSAMFMLFQFGRMGIVLFLPSIALSAVTGIDVSVCIVLMGVMATAYTAMGGIEAVIWTDVVQVIVLIGGAMLCLAIIVFNPQVGGVAGLFSTASAADKFHMFDWGWNTTDLVVWVLLVGPLFTNLMSYSSDQTVIQRYLTTKDERTAARGIWLNAAMTIPTVLLFYGLGTALFVFFKTAAPQEILPDKADYILPWFIAHHLPAGVSGLVIAGIFAASMSSLDSSMNSVATAYVTDFHRRLIPDTNDQDCLRLARKLTVLLGIIGTGTALLMASVDIKFVFDYYNQIMGLFGGALAGLFLLAVFTTRTNTFGAAVGFVSGAIAAGLLLLTTVNVYLYGAVGAVVCLTVGYATSLLRPGEQEDIEGLTVYTVGLGGAG